MDIRTRRWSYLPIPSYIQIDIYATPETCNFLATEVTFIVGCQPGNEPDVGDTVKGFYWHVPALEDSPWDGMPSGFQSTDPNEEHFPITSVTPYPQLGDANGANFYIVTADVSAAGTSGVGGDGAEEEEGMTFIIGSSGRGDWQGSHLYRGGMADWNPEQTNSDYPGARLVYRGTRDLAGEFLDNPRFNSGAFYDNVVLPAVSFKFSV